MSRFPSKVVTNMNRNSPNRMGWCSGSCENPRSKNSETLVWFPGSMLLTHQLDGWERKITSNGHWTDSKYLHFLNFLKWSVRHKCFNMKKFRILPSVFCCMPHFIMLINPCPLASGTLIYLLFLSWLRIIKSKKIRATLDLRDKMAHTHSNTNVEHEVKWSSVTWSITINYSLLL